MNCEVITGTLITLLFIGGQVVTHIDEGYPGAPTTKSIYAGRNAEFMYYVLKRGDFVKAEAHFIKDHLKLINISLPLLSKHEIEKRVEEAQAKMPVRVIYSNPGSSFASETIRLPWEKNKAGSSVGLSKGSIKRLSL